MSFGPTVQEGDLLYQPSEADKRNSNLTAYMSFLERTRGLRFEGYADLHDWSTRDLDAFWQSICDFFEVRMHTPADRVLLERKMPFTRWFEGATLNYAEHALLRSDDSIAVIACDETGGRLQLTFAELHERVARARAGLRRLGVHSGDRVAAYMPNVIETLVAFLATASLGALWSSCSPDFGVKSVLDRFRQIEPKVFLCVDGYRYGGKVFDRRQAVQEIARGLPTLQQTVCLTVLGEGTIPETNVLSFDQLLSATEPLEFLPVRFDHPLWILYSSGTTGLPKPIVQGHGGILLEHFKALSLHCDLKAGDRFFWFTTTGWMMYNFLISGLLLGTTVVLYDGSPGHPDLLSLWQLAEREKITYFGTSAPYLNACQKRNISPMRTCDLSSIKALGSTGAPLSADGFAWVYDGVSDHLLLGSVSGGTDVCTAFVLSCPLLPVFAGEIQCAGLGAKVEAFDAEGNSLIGQVGELVLTAPLPSMPVSFWGDADGSRLRKSYFSRYPGVWHHGDWVKFTERGSCLIYGRSDATLNRGGVRMGTSEFYRVVEALPEVVDSLVVDTGSLGQNEGKLWLFIVLEPGLALDDAVKARLSACLRQELSPRHVPDDILAIDEVPRTLNGKKLEVPVKRILTGTPPEQAVSFDTLKNPAALEPFIQLAGVRPGQNSPG